MKELYECWEILRYASVVWRCNNVLLDVPKRAALLRDPSGHCNFVHQKTRTTMKRDCISRRYSWTRTDGTADFPVFCDSILHFIMVCRTEWSASVQETRSTRFESYWVMDDWEIFTFSPVIESSWAQVMLLKYEYIPKRQNGHIPIKFQKAFKYNRVNH